MPRPALVAAVAVLLSACATAPQRPPQPAAPPPAFTLQEVGVVELERRYAAGELTAHAAVQQYLDRIAQLDRAGPQLHAVIELNPDALAIADERDAERAAGKLRGPLHGVPVLLKDNIDTADAMQTSAGSYALVGTPALQDAGLVTKLRDAGAIILGKANMSEWAEFRSTHGTSGWSARGGLTRNPYVLDRNACGSSSGSAVAVSANLVTLAVGTETNGSILCPSGVTGLVGVKPTVGLVSRAGIVPISAVQDTAGPMARSVADAALLLGVLAGSDARDKTSWDADKHRADYASRLDANALRGLRIGVLRREARFNADVERTFAAAVGALRAGGAIVVDNVEIPNADKLGEDELVVLEYEFKAALNAYLAGRRGVPVTSLAELIAFNEREAAREMPWFGQELLLAAQAKGPLTDKGYKEISSRLRRLAGRDGLEAALKKNRLDLIVAPTNPPAWTNDLLNGDNVTGGEWTAAAIAGTPSVTVPMGAAHGLPLGLTFYGPAWSEAQLLRAAYAYEQATHARREPAFAPTLVIEPVP